MKESIIRLFSLSHDKTSFQNSEDTLQRESKCAKDSGCLLQKKKNAIWRLRKAEDNVVQNFVLKFSQFGIKCSTETKRINLYLINDCV